MNPVLQKLTALLPKPILFGIFGALGCSAGWLLGEPLLLVIKPKADQTGDTQPAVLVFSREFNRRLEREGAKSGDIQLSLMWNNVNDLDLHCVDPRGEEISFQNKRSRTRGELDVDMNVHEPRSTEPVENIYWPKRKAPLGAYRVYVNHYDGHGGRDPTPYTVGVKVEGQAKEITGLISHGNPKRLVHEFTFQPASMEGRDSSDTPALIPTVVIAFWTALLAVGLSLALVVGQNLLLRRAALSGKQAGIVVTGGFVAGVLSGALSQYLFSFVAQVEILVSVGRMLGWTLLGSMLGFGMAMFIPNLPRKKASIAGAFGGFAGAIAFLIGAGATTDFAGRFVGAAILGFCIGMMVAIAEQIAREASLIVHWGPNEQTIINLGENPVILGSSSEAHLYLPKEKGFPPVAALVSFRNGQIEIENRMTNSKHTLQNGNKLQMGGLTVQVKTGK